MRIFNLAILISFAINTASSFASEERSSTVPKQARIQASAAHFTQSGKNCFILADKTEIDLKDPKNVLIQSGEIIADIQEAVNIKTSNDITITLFPNSQTLISIADNCTKVRSLSCIHKNSVLVKINEQLFDLSNENELVIAPSIKELEFIVTKDHVYRREMKILYLDNDKCALISEIHPISLAHQHAVLQTTLMQADNSKIQKCSRKILKTAAAISLICRDHGDYSLIGESKE